MSDVKEQYVIRWPFKLVVDDVPSGFDNLLCPQIYWIAGWESDCEDPYGDSWTHSHDAEGWMVIDVVSRHKPTPKHMDRCFVHKRLYDPFGLCLSKSVSLHCFTQGKLDKYTSGRIVQHTELSGDLCDKYEQIEPFIIKDEYLQNAIDEVSK